jgi:hypothetical protein
LRISFDLSMSSRNAATAERFDARRCAPSFLEVVRNRVTSLRCRAFGTVSVGFSGMPSEAPAPATHGNDAKSATLRVHYR